LAAGSVLELSGLNGVSQFDVAEFGTHGPIGNVPLVASVYAGEGCGEIDGFEELVVINHAWSTPPGDTSTPVLIRFDTFNSFA
jgi:hypothetical protein